MEIVSGAGLNGAAMHCLLLSRALVRRGHRVILVCHPGAWIGRQPRLDGIEVVESDLHRWPLDELQHMRAVCRTRRIDVVHTHMSRAHFFGVLLRWYSAVPSVATAHSRRLQPHWMFNDRVIAVSEATGRFHRIVNGVHRSRIDVIHNFVDPARFMPIAPGTRTAVRRSLGIDASCPLVGVVGTVALEKGVRYALRSWRRVLAAVPNARLLLVGDGPHLGALRAAAADLGVAPYVVWAGPRADIPELMAALDVFVCASLRENLPLSVLEAMAAGVSVVATRVGGLPECVCSGESGLLVPPADVRALADAVVALLGDPGRRRRLGAAARARVWARFSPATQVPLIEAALARAAARRRGWGRGGDPGRRARRDGPANGSKRSPWQPT